MNPLLQLKSLGQSPWLDYIQRGMLVDGKLLNLMENDGICGVTSNPSIFAKAILNHDDYTDAISALRKNCRTIETLYEQLVLEDIRMAADQLMPLYKSSGKRDGYVSLEVSPELAYDAQDTVNEAQRLWAAIDRANAMIKVPATRPGLVAIQELTAFGINVNATLIFSPQRYEEVAVAWQEGLLQRLQKNKTIDHIASVASFFVSRIDTLADQLLEDRNSTVLGKVAVATAKLAYQTFRKLQQGTQWQKLARHDAQLQRLLWASTSTKNPAYSDIKYVEELVAKHTVNTLPPTTLEAYLDHGHPEIRIETALDEAQAVMTSLEGHGINFKEMAAQLEQEGVRKFQVSYQKLLEALEQA